ncbi:MAG TPA: hypothetical protein VGH19_22850 [Verrucomicrobiae bacterium]
MTTYSGLLDGRIFSSDKPVVVFGWPSKSTVTSFTAKQAAWNYLEAGSRQSPKAVFARLYEFNGTHWHRIPTQPTYLQRLEMNLARSHEPQPMAA